MIEEERCMKWDSFSTKKMKFICWLIDSLINNKDSLLLNLSIDLILKQFTKILYHDFHNQVNFIYLMSNK